MSKYHPDQPAFPLANDQGAAAYAPEGQLVSAQGLTLRAHFAGLAMQGYINSYDGAETIKNAAAELGITEKEYDYKKHWPLIVAKRSVAFADALIDELNKQ